MATVVVQTSVTNVTPVRVSQRASTVKNARKVSMATQKMVEIVQVGSLHFTILFSEYKLLKFNRKLTLNY